MTVTVRIRLMEVCWCFEWLESVRSINLLVYSIFDQFANLFDQFANLFDQSTNLFDQFANLFDQFTNLFDQFA